MTMHGDGWPTSVKTAPTVRPVGLYLHTMGVSRDHRRAFRSRVDKLARYTAPGSMVPAKGLKRKDGSVDYVPAR